jgi:Family of unknown function (DUF6159)
MSDPTDWSDSKRCPSCSALNASDAAWCSQCLQKFPSAAPPAPSAPATPVDNAWVCSNCRASNSLEQDVCGSCGTPFYAPLGNERAAAAQREPVLTRSSSSLVTINLTGGTLSDAMANEINPFKGATEKVGRSFRLMGSSWQVLMKEPELLLFPLLAAAASYFGGKWVVESFWAWLVARGVPEAEVLWQVVFIVICLSFYISFINVLCHSAVVRGTILRLRGGNGRLSDSIGMVILRFGPLVVWSLIVGTVSVFLRAMEGSGNRPSLGRRALVKVGGVAWSALTFFVVPVILCEKTGPIKGLRRSAELFKSRWGESLVGTLGIGLGVALLGVPAALIVSFIGSFDASLGVEAALFSAAFLAALGATFSGIFGAAIYHYAMTGSVPAPFSQQDLDDTFHV